MNDRNETRRMALSFIMVIFRISIFNLNMLSNVIGVYSLDWSRHHRMHHRWVIGWCSNDRGYGGNRRLRGNNDRGNRRLHVVDRGRCHMVNLFFDMVDRSRHNRGWCHVMDGLFYVVDRSWRHMMNRFFDM